MEFFYCWHAQRHFWVPTDIGNHPPNGSQASIKVDLQVWSLLCGPLPGSKCGHDPNAHCDGFTHFELQLDRQVDAYYTTLAE